MELQGIQIIVAITISIIGLLFSSVNFFLGKYVATKILNNDLKHVTKDIEDLKTGDKDYKRRTLEELAKIYRRLGNIERNQSAMKAVCDERHKR